LELTKKIVNIAKLCVNGRFDDRIFKNYRELRDIIVKQTKNDNSVSFVFTFKDETVNRFGDLNLTEYFSQLGINPGTHNTFITNYRHNNERQNLGTDFSLFTLFEQIMAIEPIKGNFIVVKIKFNNILNRIEVPINSTIKELISDSLEAFGSSNDRPSDYIVTLEDMFLSSRSLVTDFKNSDIFVIQRKAN